MQISDDYTVIKQGASLICLTIKSYVGGSILTVYFKKFEDALLAIFHPSLQNWLAKNKNIDDTSANIANYDLYLHTYTTEENINAKLATKSMDIQYVLLETIDQTELHETIFKDCQISTTSAIIVNVPIVLYLSQLAADNDLKRVPDYKDELTGFIICNTELLKSTWSYRIRQREFLEFFKSSLLLKIKQEVNIDKQSLYSIINEEFIKHSEFNKYFEEVNPDTIVENELYKEPVYAMIDNLFSSYMFQQLPESRKLEEIDELVTHPLLLKNNVTRDDVIRIYEYQSTHATEALRQLGRDPLFLIMSKAKPRAAMALCETTPSFARLCRDESVFIRLLKIHYPKVNLDPRFTFKQQYIRLSKAYTPWTVGDNSMGQLGLGNNKYSRKYNESIIPIPEFNYITQISCGGSHTAMVDAIGKVWTFGNNIYMVNWVRAID